MKYGWIITRNHLDNKDIQITGPRDCPFTAEELIKEGIRFRLLDDDKEVYYSGRMITDGSEEGAFAPLYNYGLPNAGCVTIQIWEKRWVTV